MRRAFLTEDEVKQANERRLKYKGAARVMISEIHFGGPRSQWVDHRNVERLCNIFQKSGCRRFELANYVPATLSRQALADALKNADIHAHSLLTSSGKSIPTLTFPKGQLRGLHGRHRLYAASKVLAPAERWWTVDLFLDDLSVPLRTSLIEEYANERKPTDGEIYRKIRQYESEGNSLLRRKWLSRLSENNQNRMKQLSKETNEQLREGFDRLLAIPGLWLDVLTYLDHIFDTYLSFVDGDRAALTRIDPETVLQLQSKAPGNCKTDANKIKGLILGRQIFSSFDESQRKEIWRRIKHFDGIIPSLHTFWKDFYFFERCAHCIKRLFGAPKGSIWNTMKRNFVNALDSQDCLVQTSEFAYRRQAANSIDSLDIGYRQLWLYAMRHYESMPPPARNDEELLTKSERGELDESVLFEMAGLARRLGFWSKEIKQLLQRSPDRLIARNALLRARKPDHFHYEPEQFETLIDRVVECFSAAVEHRQTTCEILADTRREVASHRKKAHAQDAPHLFFDYVHAETPFPPLTTLFVRRCIYFAYFGRRSSSKSTAESSPHGITTRDISPLFVSESDSPDPAPDVQPGEVNPSWSVQENYQEETDGLVALADPMDGIENEHVSIESSVAAEDQNDSAEALEGQEADEVSSRPLLDPLDLRSPIASQHESSDAHTSHSQSPGQLSTPEESASEHEDPEQEDLNPARIYSPSVYSVRRRSSIVEDRDIEAQRRFDENLMRALQERERLDEDWERERFEQEYQALLSDTGQNQSHVAALGAMEEEVDSFEDPARQRDKAVSNASPDQARAAMTDMDTPSHAREQPIHHKPPRPAAVHSSAVIDFKFMSFDRDQFRVADIIRVEPSDTKAVERYAIKYMRKGFALYDHLQHSVSPAMCFRAGTADGINTIFMFSTEEERKLVDQKQLIGATALLPRLPDKPERPLKRRQLEQLEEVEEEL
ncbi:uncharacterized protein N7473_010323 [Penicillium subrubescens]|uniref:uncharacterized protein n=1 Tax=Penicillium subrubescens TaxID=1316194 RepID=UPI00254527C6|nr:uncharacterized protein N7473_010323 [Penicillium subrubescens]KAJ5883437.1 hypothetical protein N7473_010323 [Penicillium subrubescens]